MNNECWEALEKQKWDYIDGKKLPKGLESIQWMHLQDALDIGSVSPMECYDSIKLGYVPEHLKVRKSRYEKFLNRFWPT